MIIRLSSYRTNNFSPQTVVDKALLQEIRGNSPNPYLYGYVVFHEGWTRPMDTNIGKGISVYLSKQMVRKAYDKIEIGSVLFDGHTASEAAYITDNGLAKVVGKQMIDDSAVVVVHSSVPLETMHSISAEVTFTLDSNYIVVDVQGVHAYALLSDDEIPAFPDAHKVVTVAAETVPVPPRVPITFSEVQKAVKDMNIFPHQLFDGDTLFADHTVAGKIKEAVDLASKPLQEQLEKIKSDTAVSDTKGKVLEGIKVYPNLTDKQREFVVATVETSDLGKVTDVNKFIGDGITEFQRLAKIFGPGDTTTNPINSTPPISPADDTLTGNTVEDAMSIIFPTEKTDTSAV